MLKISRLLIHAGEHHHGRGNSVSLADPLFPRGTDLVCVHHVHKIGNKERIGLDGINDADSSARGSPDELHPAAKRVRVEDIRRCLGRLCICILSSEICNIISVIHNSSYRQRSTALLPRQILLRQCLPVDFSVLGDRQRLHLAECVRNHELRNACPQLL